VTIEQLRQRAICKKRYGRATLTIRRWGGHGALPIGRDELSRKVTAYRAGEATAEDVAWAFVRARVESHSPTFDWKSADLERLIKLVTDCSESPHLEVQTAQELAEELVKQQDGEREQLRRLSAQFAQSFAGIGNISKLLQPQLTQWAAQQQKLFADLSKSFVTPALTKQIAGLSTPTIQAQMRSLGLTASVRKSMFPTLQPSLTSSLIAGALPRQTLLAQRVRLPDTFYSEFSKSLDRSLAPYRTQTLTPTLQALARHQTFTLGEAFRAAGEAAALAEQQGAPAEARELVEVTEEVIEVVEAPSVEKLEQMVEDLRERFDERFDQLEAQQQATEDKHQEERREDLTLTLFLFFLEIYLALFLFLLEHVPIK
jgi:hypothetical protein